jgi:hypothetical protein
MPITYDNLELLHQDDFADRANWHHEGIGEAGPAPEGGMRLRCFGSKQGDKGCMCFFRPTLPDGIAIAYDIIVRSHGGLVINYLAIRGLNGEDMIADRDKLPPRPGEMKCYFARKWGLQSYHLSFSRFNDKGIHTETSNWRRNPGCLLVGHGIDPCMAINRKYHLRVTKEQGHCQLFVDGAFAHAFIDRDTTRYPIPDYGKFGFRLIGSDVMVDVSAFRIHRIESDRKVWSNNEDAQ